MFFKNLLAATTVAFLAAQAAGAPSAITGDETKAIESLGNPHILIADDAISACNCPNNCQHKVNDSCKFYQEGKVITKKCKEDEGKILECRD